MKCMKFKMNMKKNTEQIFYSLYKEIINTLIPIIANENLEI